MRGWVPISKQDRAWGDYLPLLCVVKLNSLPVSACAVLIKHRFPLQIVMLEHYIIATRDFGHTFIANMYQFVFYTDVVIQTNYLFLLCTLCCRHRTFNAVCTVAITSKFTLRNKLDELPIFNLHSSWVFSTQN